MNRSREHVHWQVVQHVEAVIGETPIYEPKNDSLYWLSLFEPALKRVGLNDNKTESWSLPSEYVGSYALYDDGSGALVAATTGIYDLQFATGEVVLTQEAPYDVDVSRFNDGRCDPQGRFWVGTLPKVVEGATPGLGYYYRMDAAGISQQIDGMTIANGTAFSPDGKKMYLADRVNGRILVYDYDVYTGTPSGGRTFISTEPGESPDGAAVDARGGYWIAMYSSGEIRRYTPEGELDRVIATPVSRPTMCAFGGVGLDRLFLTTSRLGMDDTQRASEPFAGAVFVADVGEAGIPEPHFPRRWATTPS